MADTILPYGLEPHFERAVVALCCSNSRFYGRVGKALESDALGLKPSQLAIQACHAIAAELGHGPNGSVLVVQRLQRWFREGKVTKSDIFDVTDFLDDADDAGIPTEDDMVGELAPIIKKRMRKGVVEHALDQFGSGSDLSSLKAEIDKAERLGDVDTSVGTQVGTASFSEIQRLATLDRLPFGCLEIDSTLDGGLHRKGQGVVIGGTGGGKSMTLGHLAANSLWNTMHVAFATLELPEAVQLARIQANLTGVPINAILGGSIGVAQERMEMLEGKIGVGFVKEFTANATSVEDLRDWLKACQDQIGEAVDVLIVDYADKLNAPGETRGYETGRIVFEGLRVLAVENNMWEWTASQPTRGSKDRKKIDTEDVADSMHKVRVADLVVTINPRDEGDQLLWYIAKNRLGRSRVSIGPLPHDFSCARPFPIMREAPWDICDEMGWEH